jgi:pilus assembly protein TadC
MMLTLPDELSSALDEFREATGTAPSAFVVSMLMAAIPAIKAVSQATRTLAQDQEHAISIMQDALSDALHQGSETQLEMYEKRAIRKAPTKAKKDD